MPNTYRLALLAGVFACTTALSGCGTLPESGPSTGSVMNGAKAKPTSMTTERYGGYTLVTLSEAKAFALSRHRGTQKPNPYASLTSPAGIGTIGTGDALSVTSWEPNPTGQTLFAQPAYSIMVRVGPGGSISLPYLPRVYATGLSGGALARKIEAAYRVTGHQVQVSVFDKTNIDDRVSIQGDVVRPGSYPLTSSQDRLLDLLADAGGPALKRVAAEVRVTRGSTSASAPYYDVLHDQRLDARLAPGDQVTVLPHRRTIFALGAVNRPGPVEITGKTKTLLDILGDIAGLRDDRAAPRGVFVYRETPGSTQQVVYRLNMASPDAFFIAAHFEVRSGDVVYVSDAPIANLAKVLQVIGGVSGIAGIPRNFGASY